MVKAAEGHLMQERAKMIREQEKFMREQPRIRSFPLERFPLPGAAGKPPRGAYE